jgi:4-amino-4-deoxy-L-arabinose transferase-like glycosyltransferase
VPAAAPPSERGWVAPALAIVAAVTAARLALLAFNRTDLYVDEAQYWLWGQDLDWGYYSKPPLIAWTIRAVTGLLGSDAPFAVRLPGALMHAATALLLAAIAARPWGRGAAVATAATYVTLPAVAVGSLLISTDTVMAPFLAAGLLLWLQVLDGAGVRRAFLAGLCLGVALLAKYAAIYGLLGIGLAALVLPAARPGAAAFAALLAGTLVAVAPNLAWNLAHDLTTLEHTADNIGWLRPGSGGPAPSLGAAFAFLLAQAAVAGPVVAAAAAAAAFAAGAGWRERRRAGLLTLLALLPLAIVTVQAFLGGAYANWAFAAWLPGSVLAGVWLAGRPRWRTASLAVNGAVCLVLPLLTVAPWLSPGGRPLLARYLGQAEMSRAILAEARSAGAVAVVAGRRDILADLFYTGRGSGMAVHALPPPGRPRNFYEQVHALPAGLSGPVLAVLAEPPPGCPAARRPLPTAAGAYAGTGLAAFAVDAACLR